MDLSGNSSTAGEQSFTPASTTTLSASTKYFIVFDVTVGQANLQRTSSDNLDSGASPGWDIAESSAFSTNAGTSWGESGNSLEIAVKGTAGGGTPSTDATLSGLTVTGGGSDLVTFVSGTTDYTAMVTNDVETLTFAPTNNDAGASVAYLDSDGNTLDDADTAAGHQVPLSVGANAITVRVTAENGTIQDYTVTVTRAEALQTVTIAADHESFTAVLDQVTFTLTRTGDLAQGLNVSVALTQDKDLIGSAHLAQTVTFRAGEATAPLSIYAYFFAGNTVTGETVLTATVQDGSGYVPGSPNTASTRIRVADPAVTASFEQAAYTFDEAAGDATLAVILRTATGVPVPHADIFFSINSDTITGGASPGGVDFENPAGSIQFVPSDFTADGMTFTARKEVTLAIVDDALDEPDEALTVILEPLPSTQAVVALSEPDGTACPMDTRCDATVTITDNDESAVATLSALAVSGGGAELLTFASDNTTYTAMVANDVETLTFSATKSDAGASVAYLDSDGNTLDDADTTEDGFQVALAVGANAITVRVTAENGTAAQDYTVTVTRAEGLPTVTVVAAIFPGETVAEGADAAFTLSRTGSTTAALTVTVTVSQTGAVLKDASAVPSSVTFTADAVTATLALETDDDDTDDDAGTVTVTLGAGTGYTVGEPGAATVAVSDNDVPVDFVLAVPATVAEDAGTATVTVTATTAENAPPTTARRRAALTTIAVSVTARFQVSDFAPATVDGQPRYQAEWTHDVVIHDDEEVEDDETLVLEMSPTPGFLPIHTLGGVGLDAVRATLTIVDNDLPVVTIAADKTVVWDFEGTAGFTLSRTGPTTAVLTVTVEVTQEVDRDLLPDGAAAERTVTFAVGGATTALSVALENDDLAELQGELTVEVQAGSGYTVGDPASATVTVRDGDEGQPTPANLMAEAGAGAGEVALSWDAYAPHLKFFRHQYRYKTDGNYAAWTDIPNSGQHETGAGDGSNLTGYTVTGLVGGQVHTFQVRTHYLKPDGITLVVSDSPDEAMATPRSAAVSFGAGSYSVDEGGTVEVTVQLDAAPGREVVVPVSAAGAGGATGADWSGVPESVTFGATDTEQTFTLAATDDADAETGESVALSFGTLPAGVTSGTPSQATVTIVDNDEAMTPTCTLNTGDLWCGVVTVGTSSDGVGFVAADTDVGALTDNNGDQTITIGSDSYTISSLLVRNSPAGALSIDLDKSFPTGDVATLEFDIGTKTFKLSEATAYATDFGYFWTDSGLSWSDGGPDVTLRLRRAEEEEEALPVVTIAADNNSFIDEQRNAGFTLSRTGSTAAELTVTVAVTQQVDRDYLPDGAAAERTVTFAVNSATAALRVALENDDLAEATAALTVEVQAGSGYTVGDPASATVTVLDGDTGRPTPANLTASAGAGVGEVALSWDAHAPYPVFHRHQYRYKTDGNYPAAWIDIPNSGQHTTDAGDGSNLTGYTVTGLVGGQSHTFQVRTSFLTDTSDPSDEATAAPRSAAVSFGAESYSVDEGGTVEVTVQLEAAPGREVVVPVSAAGAGGATPPGETGADWSGVPESVTFGAADTEQTFTLAATDDTDVDAGESVALSFGTLPAGVTAGTPSEATVTIVDAALPVVTIAVDKTSVLEKEGAAGFTLSRTGSTAAALAVTVAVTQEVDRDLLPDGAEAERTVTFAVGSVTMALSVELDDDDLSELLGELTVEVQAGMGYTVGDPGSATVTVLDVDTGRPTPANLMAEAEAGAGAGEVALSWDAHAPHLPFTRHQYRYKTDGNYPETWIDIPNSGRHTRDAGDGSNLTGYTVTGLVGGQLHTFQVRTFFPHDDGPEDTSAPSNEAMATPRSAGVSFGAESYSVDEGGTVDVTVQLDAAPGRAVVVLVSAAGAGGATPPGETGADWSGVPESVTFGATDTEQTFTLAATDDTDADAGESVALSFGTLPAGVTAGTPSQATVTIVDNDVLPSVSVGDATAAEGAPVEFPVTLSAASGREVEVNWATTDDSATSPADFTAASGTLTFMPGETTATVAVATEDDTLDEPAETFTLTLSSPSNATLAADATATGTITDNDDPPTLGVADAAATEGDPVEFTVTLSAAATDDVTATWTASTIEGDEEKAAAADLESTTGPVTVTKGETTATFTVATAEDALDETDETFTVALSSPSSNATLAADATTATGRITDDDARPALVIADVSAPEDSNVEFTVTLTPASGRTVTVAWGTFLNSGQTAEEADFTSFPQNGFVTFSPGQTTAQLQVAVVDDELVESDETFEVTLGSASNARLEDNSATGTIVDNDVAPNAAPAFTSSGTFTPAENQTAAGTVRAEDSDGDAITDYALSGGTDQALFSIGSTSGALTFLTAPNYEDPQDANTDNAYVVVVRATSGTGARVKTADQTITVTVRDDDTEAPGAPDAPSVSPASVTSLNVSWSAPDNDGPEITDYDVQYRAGTSGPWSDGSHIGTALTAILTGLAEDTEYDVQVRATNDEGTGGWSASGSGAKDANAAPSFTSSATFNPAENQTTVGTVAASDSDTGDAITDYALSGGTDQALFSIGSMSGALTFQAAPNYEDPQDANTDNAYLVVVQATSGTGDREKTGTQTITVRVMDDDTEAPSATSLNVSWPAPDNDGPEITDYDVQYRAGTSGPWSDGSHIGAALTAILTGLLEDTSYQVQVRATNDEGTSGWSASGSGSTDANAAPSFTSAAMFTPAENQTAVGTVAASDSDAGDEVTDYALSGGTDQALFSIGSTSGVLTFQAAPNYEDPQDANTDNAYLVVVQATSGTGDREKTGTQTITVRVMDADEQPDKLAKATVTATSGSSTSLAASWTEPGLNGGPELTGYQVRYRSRASATDPWSASADWPHTGTTTTTTITGLTADTEYQVDVSALNGETPTAWSDASDAVRTNSAVDNAPVFSETAPRRAVPENSAAGVDVGAPVTAAPADSGDELTYTLEGTDASSFDIVSTSGQIQTKSGVTYNYEEQSSYAVTVKASDATASATIAVTINLTDADEQPDKPAKPTLAAVSGSFTSLVASWTEPGLNGGPELTGYNVEYREGTMGDWETFTHGGTGVARTITGLMASTSYQVRVQALNGETPSAWSDASDAVSTNAPATIPVGPEVTLQLSDDKVFENGQVTVTATVSPASPVAFTVAISATPVAPATADDFTLSTNRVLRFAADATESTGTVTIGPVDDEVPEPDDVVRVSGAVSNAAIEDPDDVTVEIINDDPEDLDLAVSAPPAVDEGAGAAVVTVTLTTRRNTAPTAYTDLYYLSKPGETATRGDDYTPPAGVDYGTAGVLFARVQPSVFSPNAAGTAWVAEPSFTIGIIDDQEAEVAETIVFEVDFPGDQTPAHTITLRDNDAVAPGRPTGLKAAAKSQTRIQLAWTAPEYVGIFSITGYRIEVSADAGGRWDVLVADTRNTRTSKPHAGLSAGDTRHYRVSAISPAGTSGPSTVASATTLAAGPGATNPALPPRRT